MDLVIYMVPDNDLDEWGHFNTEMLMSVGSTSNENFVVLWAATSTLRASDPHCQTLSDVSHSSASLPDFIRVNLFDLKFRIAA
jgi:hypothetical protein